MKNWFNTFIDTQFDHLDSMMIVCGLIFLVVMVVSGFFDFSPVWAVVTAFTGTILLTGTRVVMALGQWRKRKQFDGDKPFKMMQESAALPITASHNSSWNLTVGHQPKGADGAETPPGDE